MLSIYRWIWHLLESLSSFSCMEFILICLFLFNKFCFEGVKVNFSSVSELHQFFKFIASELEIISIFNCFGDIFYNFYFLHIYFKIVWHGTDHCMFTFVPYFVCIYVFESWINFQNILEENSQQFRKYNVLIVGQLINETQFHNYWGKVLKTYHEIYPTYRRMCVYI